MTPHTMTHDILLSLCVTAVVVGLWTMALLALHVWHRRWDRYCTARWPESAVRWGGPASAVADARRRGWLR